MSDLPLKSNYIHYIPDDMIYEIMSRCDHKTVGRCKSLSKLWRMRLHHPYFLETHKKHFENQQRAIIVQFGCPVWKLRNDWISSILTEDGSSVHFRLPFRLSSLGWFNLIGACNRNICVRYSMTSIVSKLVVWNPLTRAARRIDDPLHNNGFHSVFTLAFGYLPNTTEYRILHLYKRTSSERFLSFTTFSPKYNKWRKPEFSSESIKNLDSSYVTVNGMVYWINLSGRQFDRPQAVVSCSLSTLQYMEIVIPECAKAEYQNLIVHDDKLGYISYCYGFWKYDLTLWSLEINKLKRVIYLGRVMRLSALSLSETPALFVDDELIMVLESNNQAGITNDSHVSKTYLTAMRQNQRTRRFVRAFYWNEEVEVKNVALHVKGIYPV